MSLPNRKFTLGRVLGEIAIIIVGILLSLAISGWFEDRKEAKREHAYLRQLTTELSDDLDQLRSDLAQRQKQLDITNNLLRIITTDDFASNSQAFSRGLPYLSYTINFEPNDATFETLKATGQLAMIEREGLATNLISLYENRYNEIDLNNSDVTNFRNDFLLPFLVERLDFSTVDRRPSRKQMLNLRKALMEPSFLNRLVYNRISLESTVGAHERTIEAVAELLAGIE